MSMKFMKELFWIKLRFKIIKLIQFSGLEHDIIDIEKGWTLWPHASDCGTDTSNYRENTHLLFKYATEWTLLRSSSPQNNFIFSVDLFKLYVTYLSCEKLWLSNHSSSWHRHTHQLTLLIRLFYTPVQYILTCYPRWPYCQRIGCLLHIPTTQVMSYEIVEPKYQED